MVTGMPDIGKAIQLLALENGSPCLRVRSTPGRRDSGRSASGGSPRSAGGIRVTFRHSKVSFDR